MSDHALVCRLRTLIAVEPGLGYRALHARLKEDPEFPNVGLKRVQSALQQAREVQDDLAGPVDQQQQHQQQQDQLGSPPIDTGGQEGLAEEWHLQLPGAPTAQELQGWRCRGKHFEIKGSCLTLAVIPGRGKGYLAAKSIKKGDILLIETAFCSSTLGPSEFIDMAIQCNRAEDAAFFRDEVMSLTCGASQHHALEDILQNNVYQCSRDCEYSALFVATARFNHACCPNAFVDSTRALAVVRALGDISEGEEVLTSYVPVSDVLEARQSKLATKGFLCACSRCQEEALASPCFLVPCRCGNFQFSMQDDSLPLQECVGCGSPYDRAKSVLNFAEVQQANEFMRTPAAAQSDTRHLVQNLSPLRDLLAVGAQDGAPPANTESIQLLNSLANCHRFCAVHLTGQHHTTAMGEFFACKAQLMHAYELIHGRNTTQRDLSYLINLHRLLNDELAQPSHAILELWKQKLLDACMLQFGQPLLPPGVSADLSK
ncbi:unnamed protein product [Polarella glacialis]|uniref:SET domain-containing protein n=1 Tax=Polarella glacialis TaxID=89957 RepID=A0A813GCH7_POLGL|nr:unnamed protein product [Polarella glacialis]